MFSSIFKRLVFFFFGFYAHHIYVRLRSNHTPCIELVSSEVLSKLRRWHQNRSNSPAGEPTHNFLSIFGYSHRILYIGIMLIYCFLYFIDEFRTSFHRDLFGQFRFKPFFFSLANCLNTVFALWVSACFRSAKSQITKMFTILFFFFKGECIKKHPPSEANYIENNQLFMGFELDGWLSICSINS